MRAILKTSGTVAAALILLAHTATAQVPASGIDPAVVRINAAGITQLGEEGVPYLLDAAGLDHVTFPGQVLFDQSVSIVLDPLWLFPIGPFLSEQDRTVVARATVRRGATVINIPLNAEAVQFSFQGNGAANAGQLRCIVDAPGASVSTSITLTVDASHPLLDMLPADIYDFFSIDDTFSISAVGANLDATIGVTRNAANQFAFSVSSLSGSVDSVSLEHSGLLDEIVDFLGVGACTIMGQPGGNCSVNTAAARLSNSVLRGANTATVRNRISTAASNAFRGVGDIGGSVNVAFPNGSQLACGTTLGSFNTAVNRLIANWNLSVQRNTGSAFPNLTYGYLTRAAQSPSTEAAAGDMQVWLPLSLFDKTAFELLKTGMLSAGFQTPAASANIGGVPINIPAMTVTLQNPGVPRATSEPADPSNVRLSFATSLAGSGGNASCSLASSLSVRLRIIESGRDLSWQLVSLAATEPTGTITIGGVTYNMSQLPALLRSQFRVAIQNAMVSQWQQMAGTTKLMDNVIDLGDGWELGVSGVQFGARYMRVNLDIE